MALIDRVKERFEADVTDIELQLIIDEANSDIIKRHGPIEQPITVFPEGGGYYLFLPRRIEPDLAVTVTETVGTTDTVLAADDFDDRHGGLSLLRLDTGTNKRSRWARRVKVTYTPWHDGNQRQETIIKLVQLALTYKGLIKQEKAGDYQGGRPVTPDAYAHEREALIGSLGRGGLMLR